MKNFFGFILRWTIGLSIFVFIVGGITWGIAYDTCYREIPLRNYFQVKEWSKAYPEIKEMAEDAIWEDGIIDISEWNKIKRTHYNIVKNAVIQETVGE